jgi:hypothetical protein
VHATLPLLEVSDFPAIRRERLATLQVNLGYKCNQTCVHCHVNAGPARTEEMDRETDRTPGCLPEAWRRHARCHRRRARALNAHFRELSSAPARSART